MVNTRTIAAEYRLAHWTQIMQDRKQRGLSIRAYCEKIGISKNTYFYWQKKLRVAACEELLTISQPEVSSDNSAAPMSWAMCEVSSKSSGEDKVLRIEINGCHVLANTDTDPELLARTCKVLMSLC